MCSFLNGRTSFLLSRLHHLYVSLSVFFASSQTINLFSFFPFIFLCENFVCARQKTGAEKEKKTRAKRERNVKRFADLKRCLKHKILFLLHMLSSFRLRALLLGSFWAILEYRFHWNRTEHSRRREKVALANMKRNFYQIIIFVLSFMIAGVANGNCSRQIHLLMLWISLFARWLVGCCFFFLC